jgi:hypothetical protein
MTAPGQAGEMFIRRMGHGSVGIEEKKAFTVPD